MISFWKKIKYAVNDFLVYFKILRYSGNRAELDRIGDLFLTEFNLYEKYGRNVSGLKKYGMGKLDRIYKWHKGDLPDIHDHVQWLILLDYQKTIDEVTETKGFNGLWGRTPDGIKRKFLMYYLSNIYPWADYHWKAGIPNDDLSTFNKLNDILIALYPYIFHRNDVPFLFDSKIPKPGSGLEGAWEIDISRAWAIHGYRDVCDEDEFKKAISNEKPLRPNFVFSNDKYKIDLPKADLSHIEAPKVFTTAYVSQMEVSDGEMSVDLRAIEKIIQINRREEEKENGTFSISDRSHYHCRTEIPEAAAVSEDYTPKETLPTIDESLLKLNSKVNTKQEGQPGAGLTYSIPGYLSANNHVPSTVLSQPLTNFQQNTVTPLYETSKETKNEQICINQPVEATLNEADMPPSYWQRQRESLKNQKNSSMNFDDHIPQIPPPQDGERVLIGTGYTQRLLGHGGQGRVYESYSEELEMPLAVKICFPPPWVTDVNQIILQKNKFMREIKIQANLHHSNIVQIFTYGEWNKYPFVEMEFVNGADISRLLQKYGRIDPVVVLALSVQMLSSLNYAHTRTYTIDQKDYEGIIHRDIKPGNVIVSSDGYVKLLDFGIALPFGMISMTVQMGNIVGTIPYASPEQLSGKELDPRSDIYSIGVLLYEMLVGKPAFGHGSSLQDVINNVITGNYKKIDDYNFKIPKSVKKIVNHAMQKDPNRRFESSSVMLNVCLQTLYELTREMPEAIVKEFVNGQNFRDITASYRIPPNMLPKRKRKFFFM